MDLKFREWVPTPSTDGGVGTVPSDRYVTCDVRVHKTKVKCRASKLVDRNRGRHYRGSSRKRPCSNSRALCFERQGRDRDRGRGH